MVGEGRAGVQPWVGQKPFCCYDLEKTKLQKSHEANLGLGLTWKGGAVCMQKQSMFSKSQASAPKQLSVLADASFCRWDGSCRIYSLVLPSCASWMGAGLWPCCWDAVAVVATGWMPVLWAPAVCVGSSVGLVDLHPGPCCASSDCSGHSRTEALSLTPARAAGPASPCLFRAASSGSMGVAGVTRCCLPH